MKHRILLFLGLLWLCPFSAHADTTWVNAGNVSGNWTASNSPFMVHEGTITVPMFDTLRIHPGVTVLFTGPYRLNVAGILCAIGSSNDSILFSSNLLANPGGWRGIRLLHTVGVCSLEYCIIEHGVATHPDDDRYGGGLEVRACNPVISRCTIRYNQALIDGGGVYCRDNSAPTFTDCLIWGNYVPGEGGAGLFSRFSNPCLLRCIFRLNTTFGFGGGVAAVDMSVPEISDCIFEENYAADGGGLFLQSCSDTLAIQRSSFSGNRAQRGGGVYDSSTKIQFTNCQFNDNKATDIGGAVFFANDTTWINYCTFSDDSATSGAEVSLNRSTTDIQNSILSFSSGGTAILSANNSNYSQRSCDMYGHVGGNFSGTIPAFLGQLMRVNLNEDSTDRYRNLFMDPLFSDRTHGDLSLSQSSPCISAALSSSAEDDHDGNPRPSPLNSQPDMGAYESEFSRNTLYACGQLRGEIGPGDVLVGCDISVESNDTLTILAGTRFLFAGHYRFTVRGVVSALGTASDSIFFSMYTQSDSGNWLGFRFLIWKHSEFNYCVIENVNGENADHTGTGAIWCDSSSTPRFTSCSIRNNSSDLGGGVSCYDCWPYFSFCKLNNNTATLYGGAIYCTQHGSPRIYDCDINSNTAVLCGGGLYYDNGSPAHHRTSIRNNTAQAGGGAYLKNIDWDYVFGDCIFRDNTSQNGAGIFFTNCIATNYVPFTRCIFTNNIASDTGGAMYCRAEVARINSCIITSNTAGVGAGIYIINATPQVSSSIISRNSGAGLYFRGTSSGSIIKYSDFYSPTGNNIEYYLGNNNQGPVGLGLLTQLNHNFDSCDNRSNILLNPQFTDSNSDYHLRTTSPCINSGDATLPCDSDGTYREIGLYFFPVPPPTTFDLLSPNDENVYSREDTIQFCWQAFMRPDCQGFITYTLFLTTLDTTVRRVIGPDTCRRLITRTLNVGDTGRVEWYVEAHTFHPDTIVRSVSTHHFRLSHPSPPPSPFDLLTPMENDTINKDTLRFIWQASHVSDSSQTVIYTLVLATEDSLYTIPCELDTNVLLHLDSLTWGDSAQVTWYALAYSTLSDSTIRSLSVRHLLYINPISDASQECPLPALLALHECFPNPFNSVATISFDLPATCSVKVDVFDITGRLVQQISLETMVAGCHNVQFNGNILPSGIYFAHLQAGGYSKTTKMMLIK